MGFNLQAFGAGFAKKLTENIDAETTRQATLDSQIELISKRHEMERESKRVDDQAEADEIADSLSLYYKPDQVESIMKGGKRGIAHAVKRAEHYTEKGFDPSTMYTMPNNDISSMDTAGTTSIGDVSKVSGVPEGMDGDTFVSRFKTIEPTKEFKTIAAFQVSLLQERIDAGTDPDKIAIVDEKEKQFFAQASKLENAKRKPEDTNPVNFYTNTDRFKLINGMRELARNNRELTVGEGGKLMGDYRGSNRLSLAELDASLSLKTQNNLVGQEEVLYNEIKSMTNNALNALDAYAKANYKKVKSNKVFENKEELQKEVGLGNIGVGDTYIVKLPVNGGEMYATGTYIGTNYTDIGIEKSYRLADWLPNYTSDAARP
jgi:hypothetical protein